MNKYLGDRLLDGNIRYFSVAPIVLCRRQSLICQWMPRGYGACRSFEKRKENDWKQRKQERADVLYSLRFRDCDNNNDCIDPVSGEKAGELKTYANISVNTIPNRMILNELLIVGLVDCGVDTVKFSLDGISPE